MSIVRVLHTYMSLLKVGGSLLSPLLFAINNNSLRGLYNW